VARFRKAIFNKGLVGLGARFHAKRTLIDDFHVRIGEHRLKFAQFPLVVRG